MKKALDYILSSIYIVYFGVILVIFHVLQVIAFNIFGKRAHQIVVNALNFCICYGWLLTGTTIRLRNGHSLPKNRSIIFIANHQSMFDIPGIIWFLRKYTPLFVAKFELSKGIPSISYNLRKGGAALINRKDKNQAMKEIGRLGDYICRNNYSAAIFPEGTRSKDGNLKSFAPGGIASLLNHCPQALIVPLAIKNTWKFNPKGFFPLSTFSKLSWTVLEPIEPKDLQIEDLIEKARNSIQIELATK